MEPIHAGTKHSWTFHPSAAAAHLQSWRQRLRQREHHVRHMKSAAYSIFSSYATRPMLMAGVGRQVQSGGQGTVKVSILHEKGDVIAKAVTGSVVNGSPACQLRPNHYSADENQPKLPPSAAPSNASPKGAPQTHPFSFLGLRV